GATLFKNAKSLKEIPQSVSVLTRQQMDDRNIGTVEKALGEVPGIYIENYGSDISRPGIIWSRGSQMYLQFDGVSTNSEGTFFRDSGNQADMEIYDRLEVLKGPAGLLSGVGSPSGVANLVRKRPQRELMRSASVSAGSWNNYHATVDVGGPLDAQGRLRARAVLAGQNRDFFYSPGWSKNWTAYGILEYDLTPDTTLAVSLTHTENHGNPWWTGQPLDSNGQFLDISRSKRIGTDWNQRRNRNDEFFVELDHRFNEKWTLKATGRYTKRKGSSFEAHPYSAVDSHTALATWRLVMSDEKRENLGGDIHLDGTFDMLGRQHELTLGYTLDRYESDVDELVQSLGKHNVFDFPWDKATVRASAGNMSPSRSKVTQSGWYGVTRLKLSDPLTLVLGVRVSDYTPYGWSAAAGWSKRNDATKGEVTPYAGLVYDLNRQITLYASYADVFQPQRVYGIDGILEPVLGWQIKGGVKGEFFNGRLNTSLALFEINKENEAMLDDAHVGCGPSLGDCYKASGLTRTRGWEIEASGSPLPHLQLSAGYTRSESIIRKSATPNQIGTRTPTYVPEHLVKLWGKYRFSEGFLAGFDLGAGARWQSGIWRTLSKNTIRQGAYALVDASIGYRFSPLTELALNINNVFDKKYYARLGGNEVYTMYGEPRSWMLTVRSSF
ncbi:MAG: TonB-dependent siderophore receptor, partial [Zoogloeaceae bacterium]|nr:TonB-dependent siderophore receptor [Zoogloeaceae bacterium]